MTVCSILRATSKSLSVTPFAEAQDPIVDHSAHQFQR
jgi:hypothetical protein